MCVLRFAREQLTVISSSLSEPQLWCTIEATAFETYEVESTRDNIISLELNIELLLQVLKSFHRAPTLDELKIRLQRKSPGHGLRSAVLALLYAERNPSGRMVTNTFRIPVRALSKENDERIHEPLLPEVDVMLQLPPSITSLFKRIERYKRADKVAVCATKNGYLGLTIQADGLKVTISWNTPLPVGFDASQSQADTGDPDEQLVVDVKLKDWRLGAKMCDFCSKVVLMVCNGRALALRCHSDDGESEIIYFLSSVMV